MTRRIYRALQSVWLLCSLALLALVIVAWLRLIPFEGVFVGILVLGGAAAIAGWLIRDQSFEELPE